MNTDIEDTQSLMVERKKDREIMSSQIETLVRRFGYLIERQRFVGQTAICLFINANEVKCYVDLDGDAYNPESYVLPWHTSGKNLSDAFGYVAGAGINPHHRWKCTAVVYGFNKLLLSMESVLTLIADNKAFEVAA